MTMNKQILILAGLILILISIVCEVMLFIDYADNRIDKIIAGLSAAALVVCQFSFVPLAIKKWQTNKVLAMFISSIICVLFMVSVSGTAAFFESRFSSKNDVLTKTSNEYMLKQKTINDLFIMHNLFIDSANKAKEEGNNWYAGEQLKEASKINKQRLELIESLKEIEVTPKDSGTALAKALDKSRWTLWLLMAILVDLCPIVCFASLNITSERLTNDKKENLKRITETIRRQMEYDESKKQNKKQKPIKTTNTPKSENMQKYEVSHDNPQNDLKTAIEQHLKLNRLTGREFCKAHNIKEKHLSLAKNHDKNKSLGKETAPLKVLEHINSIVNRKP